MPDNSVPSATALTFEEYWGRSDYADYHAERVACYAWEARQPEIGIVLSHAAPRMLATIAAHEATITELRKQLRAQDDDMKAWKESE